LPEVERPVVLQGAPAELSDLLAVRGEGDVRFDALIGRSVLAGQRSSSTGWLGLARALADLLQPTGTISLAEPVPQHVQRLYALVDWEGQGEELAAKVRAAEELIYSAADDPLVNWTEDDLLAAFRAEGFAEVTVESQETVAEARITPALLARWFGPAPAGERPSYSQRLAAVLSAEELATVRALYERRLTGQAVPWRSVTAYLVARAAKK
jgi:hypothetical protein